VGGDAKIVDVTFSNGNRYTSKVVGSGWLENKTGEPDVMFRASTDNGLTFGPKDLGYTISVRKAKGRKTLRNMLVLI
jgi:hypothetical protein